MESVELGLPSWKFDILQTAQISFSLGTARFQLHMNWYPPAIPNYPTCKPNFIRRLNYTANPTMESAGEDWRVSVTQLQCSERLRMVTMKKLAFLGCRILLLASILAVDSKSDGLGEWHILTKQNFSSQIRLHPHILLVVTLPCNLSLSDPNSQYYHKFLIATD